MDSKPVSGTTNVRPQGSVLYEGCERRRKGLGAAVLQDRAECISILLGQRGIHSANLLLDF
jgi:hypothetical protein